MKTLILTLTMALAALVARAQSTVTLSWNYPAALVTPGDTGFKVLAATNLAGPYTTQTNCPSTMFTNAISGTNMPCSVQLPVVTNATPFFWEVESISQFWQQTNQPTNIPESPAGPLPVTVGISHP